MRCPRLAGRPRAGWSRGIGRGAWALLVAMLGVGGLCGPQPVLACEKPLVANIGHALTEDPPSWSTSASRTVSTGQTVYFHALSASGAPLQNTNDQDYVNGQIKQDTAHYDWDWCWDTGYDAFGLAVSKTYYWPGNRCVWLHVWDTDGSGYTDDQEANDSVLIKVKLTLETDWMNGKDIITSGTDENGDPFTLSQGWGEACHTLSIDPDHQTNCEYFEYIGEKKTDDQIRDWLDAYENQGCHTYLMGGHRYKHSNDPGGQTFDHRLSIVYMGAGGGLPTWYKLAAEIHEPLCHDATIDDPSGIGHCDSADPCCAKATATSSHVCDSCRQEVIAAIEESS